MKGGHIGMLDMLMKEVEDGILLDFMIVVLLFQGETEVEAQVPEVENLTMTIQAHQNTAEKVQHLRQVELLAMSHYRLNIDEKVGHPQKMVKENQNIAGGPDQSLLNLGTSLMIS